MANRARSYLEEFKKKEKRKQESRAFRPFPSRAAQEDFDERMGIGPSTYRSPRKRKSYKKRDKSIWEQVKEGFGTVRKLGKDASKKR